MNIGETTATIELYHFIGKDIIYFHALFWPAIITRRLISHADCDFSTWISSPLMAKKCRNHAAHLLNARTYLKSFTIRNIYVIILLAKLSNRVEDLDINFVISPRVNRLWSGKFVNIASRSASFITENISPENYLQNAFSQLIQRIFSSGHEICETIRCDGLQSCCSNYHEL